MPQPQMNMRNGGGGFNGGGNSQAYQNAQAENGDLMEKLKML